MALWRRLLERFVPSLEEEPSRLDRLDGVGRLPLPEQSRPGHEAQDPRRGSQPPRQP